MDQIDQRLALLQHDLQERPPLIKVLSESGWLLPALGCMGGILAQTALKGPPGLWLLLTIPLLAAVVTVRKITPQSLWLPILAAFAFAFLGALRMIHYHAPGPNDIRHSLRSEPRLVALRGTVWSVPVVHRSAWATGQSYRPPTTTFYFRIQEGMTPGGWSPMEGTVRVRVGGSYKTSSIGDRLELVGRLERILPPGNPGQFDLARYLELKRIRGNLFVKNHLCIIQHSHKGPKFWIRVQARLRSWAQNSLYEAMPDRPADMGLLQALILGDRTQLTPDIQESFTRTGLLHLISLSGMHVGILMALIWKLGKALGLLKPGRAVLCAFMLAIFVIIVPPRAPTLRAVLIGWIFCVGFLIHRRTRPLHSLSCAALLLLLIRPTQLFEVGWQLSFACVLGILLWTRPLLHWFELMSQGRLSPAPYGSPWYTILWHYGLHAAVSLLCVGLSAYIAGAGILIYHFHAVTPLACVWTVLVFPLIALLLCLGFAKILFGFLPVWDWLLAFPLRLLLILLTYLVSTINRLNIGPWIIGAIPGGIIVGYYLGLLSISIRMDRSRLRRRWPLPALAGVLACCVLFACKVHHHRPDGLVMTCLDVGHGQTVVLQTKNQCLLIDAGSLATDGAARAIINPFLDYIGMNRIDSILLSHYDADHFNAVPNLIRYRPTGSILVNQYFHEQLQTDTPLALALADHKVRLENYASNMSWGPELRLQVLWPRPDFSLSTSPSDNDTSAVLLFRYAGRCFLFCGDIESTVQRHLLDLYPDLRVDVMVAPHHGSLKTLHQPFIERLDPRILISSCGRSQFSQGRIIADAPNRQTLVTARDGAIRISVDSSGAMNCATWRPDQHF